MSVEPFSADSFSSIDPNQSVHNAPAALQAGLLEFGPEGAHLTEDLDDQVDATDDGPRVSMYVAAFEG